MAKIKIKSHDNKDDSNKFGFVFSAKGTERDVMSLLMAAIVSFADEIGMKEKNLIEGIKGYSKQLKEEGEK